MMEMCCVSVAPMAKSLLLYGGGVLQDVTIGGKRAKTTWDLSIVFLKTAY
jgi:hypothetical protein